MQVKHREFARFKIYAHHSKNSAKCEDTHFFHRSLPPHHLHSFSKTKETPRKFFVLCLQVIGMFVVIALPLVGKQKYGPSVLSLLFCSRREARNSPRNYEKVPISWRGKLSRHCVCNLLRFTHSILLFDFFSFVRPCRGSARWKHCPAVFGKQRSSWWNSARVDEKIRCMTTWSWLRTRELYRSVCTGVCSRRLLGLTYCHPLDVDTLLGLTNLSVPYYLEICLSPSVVMGMVLSRTVSFPQIPRVQCALSERTIPIASNARDEWAVICKAKFGGTFGNRSLG